MKGSLWGEEFSIPDTKKETKKVIKKIKEPKSPEVKTEKIIKSKTIPIEEKLKLIYENVLRILGVYKEKTQVIKTKEELSNYIDAAISNGIIAIDTETNNSLDPITCKLMGPCFYTPGQKNAYVPINHVNLHTRERLAWQLTEEDIKEQLERLDNVKIIMHNGKFDYQVLKITTGKQLKIFWDTIIGARLLNENELSKLKEQYISKIDPSIEKYSIEHLFEDVEYAIVDPDIFALYAATDAYMTYKLYEYQLKEFSAPGCEKLFNLFKEVEMPIVEIAAEMELTGIEIDKEYGERLSKKYHDKLDSLDLRIDKELERYKDPVESWRLTEEANFHPVKKKKDGTETVGKSKSEQLQWPINLSSPTQLAILLYDVLKQPVIDTSAPRGTGEDILLKLNLPICKLILERRGLLKLIDTYIDKLPKCVSEKTGRLHAHFNQIGADTGRFSSSDPNLQNIPSKEKSIRMLFKASEGYVMVGSDFSQQEPRLLANYAQDDNMINAYKEGKDLYATIAAGVYKNDYWDNMEAHKDGTPNPEGKKRRSDCKSLLLGIMYGRGVASIAEQIGGSIKDAQKIVDDFYTNFPKIKNWVSATEEFAKRTGYVEDLWGRRRRLPDIQLPKYTAREIGASRYIDFNPLLGSLGKVKKQKNPNVEKYLKEAEKCVYKKDRDALKAKAYKDGILLDDNGGFIAQAERQCVNARVQGGAATMSKKAMIKVYNDDELKRLGFRLMLAVHDELIGECPEENKDEVADRLTYLMKISALPECTVPFKCDPTIEKVWYYTDYSDYIHKEHTQNTKNGMSFEESFKRICEEHCECTSEQLKEILV